MDQRMTDSLHKDLMRRLGMLAGCREMLAVSADPAEVAGLLRLVGQHGFEVARVAGTLSGVLGNPYRRWSTDGETDDG